MTAMKVVIEEFIFTKTHPSAKGYVVINDTRYPFSADHLSPLKNLRDWTVTFWAEKIVPQEYRQQAAAAIKKACFEREKPELAKAIRAYKTKKLVAGAGVAAFVLGGTGIALWRYWKRDGLVEKDVKEIEEKSS